MVGELHAILMPKFKVRIRVERKAGKKGTMFHLPALNSGRNLGHWAEEVLRGGPKPILFFFLVVIKLS